MCSCAFASSCYGAVQSLSGDAERDVAVEAVGQGECSLYNEDTVTDEEGRFRLRGLLVREGFKPWGGGIELSHTPDAKTLRFDLAKYRV